MAQNEYPNGVENTGVQPVIAQAAPDYTVPGAAEQPSYQTPPAYQVPPQQAYGQQPYGQQPPAQAYQQRSHGIGSARKEKWPAVILAFVLGTLGIHKFYLGYKSEGLVMLLVSIIGGFCFGIGTCVMVVISLIEAVKYISLTEEEFEATYVYGYKGWL